MMADQASHESILSRTTIEGSRYASLRGAELAETLADIVRGQKPSDLSAFERLNLRFAFLGRWGPEILVECLLSGHLSNLEVLDLSRNNVGDAELVAFAQGFKAGHLKNFKKLDLHGNQMGEAGLVALAECFKEGHLSILEELHLSENKVGDKGLVALAEGFKAGHLSNLEELHLSENKVGDKGLVALAEGFKAQHLRNFKKLDLHGNEVGVGGLVALAECLKAGHLSNLEELHLSENKVGDAGLVALAEGFKAQHLRNFKKLDLGWIKGGESGLRALAEGFKSGHLSNLEELRLDGNKVGDAGLVALAEGFKALHLSNIKKLNLRWMKVGDAGLKALAEGFKSGHLSNLEELSLCGNKVQDTGVKALAEGFKAGHLSNLEKLSLHRNKVGDAGLMALAEGLKAGHVSNLEKLDLSWNQVGDAGLVALAECFKGGHCRNFRKLELGGNKVRAAGVVALAEGFKAGHLSNLEKLSLRGNKVGDAGLMALADGFKAGHVSNLEKLDLSWNQVGDAGLVALGEGFRVGDLSNLEELCLSENKVGDKGLVALAEGFKAGHFSNLEMLVLSQNKVGEAGLVALAECFKGGHLSNLERLDLGQNNVGDSGVVALAEGFKVGHLSNLEELHLSENKVGGKGLVALAQGLKAGHVSNLEKLDMSQNQVGDAGLVALAECFKAGHSSNLKMLDLSHNEVGDSGMVALGEGFKADHLSNLEMLNLSKNKVGEVGLVALAEGFTRGHLRNVEMLDLSSNEVGDAGLVTLAEGFKAGHVSNLEKLNLSWNQVGDTGLVALGEGFKGGHLSNLEMLVLCHNKVGDAGLVALAECLKGGHLNNVEMLDLSWNQVREAGLVALVEGFKGGHCRNFSKLDLGGNKVRDAGVVALAEGFKAGHLSNLEMLDLSQNQVGDSGLVALADGFKAGHVGNLKKLNLSWNQVGDTGVVALAEGLKAGDLSTLELLDMSGNKVGDRGLVALAEGLKAGYLSNLEELDLSRNKVGDAGLVALLNALHKSSSKSIRLQKVYLDNNLGFGEAVLDLARALEAGYLQSLTYIELGRASEVARQAILSAYQTNPTVVLDVSFERYVDLEESSALERLRNLNLKWTQTFTVLEGEDNVVGTNGKVFLCGNTAVGKTTLKETLVRKRWRAMFTNEKKLGKDRKPTRGIEVSHMIVSKDKDSSDKQSLMLSLWDLAGQPDYDVLHSAFLPDLALGDGQATFFVIVCSANQRPTSSVASAEDDLRYWLKFISSYSRETGDQDSRRKVLVVLNCFKGDWSGYVLEEWKGILVECTKKFGNFVNIHPIPFIVDVRVANEVKSLKSELKMQAKNMLLNRHMPAICLRVQETCRKWAEKLSNYPVLSWEQYSSRLFRDSMSKEKLEAATAYLHEAGQLVLFRKGALTQGGLEDVTLVILNPEWFCRDLVGNLLLPESMALENENLLRRKVEPDGSLLRSTLQEKLANSEDKVKEVVAILLRLGLCYLAHSMPEKIFVPALIETDDAPEWPNAASRSNSSIRNQNLAWVMGFSLVLEDSSRTLLPIALLRKLQVELAQDKTIGGRGDCKLAAGKSFITFRCEGKDVLVEFSSNGRNSEDRSAKTKNSKQDRLDILVTPLQLVDEANSASAREEQVNLAQRIVNRAMGISTECPGVKLVRKIIEPWNVADGLLSITHRNTSTSVEDVIARVKENGRLGTMNWTVGNELVKEEELLSEGDLEDIRSFAEARRDVIEEAVETLDLFNITDNPVESNVDPDDPVESNVDPNDQTRVLIGEFRRENAKMHQITHKTLDEIKNDVKDVKASLHKALKQQKDIIHRVLCHERFTTGYAESSVPRYAYLTEAGKPNGWVDWKSTLKSLYTHTITIHFLCEAPASNHELHEVDGQVGVDVKRLKDWAQKLAPVLDWSLKIAFVTATIASSAILPGLGVWLSNLPKVTNASKLTSGIASLLDRTSTAYSSAHEHQSVSDSQADILGQLSNKAKVPTLHRGEELRGVARKAVKELLDQLNPQEFKQQVGLTRVRILNPAYGDADHVVWICDKCLDEYGNRAREI